MQKKSQDTEKHLQNIYWLQALIGVYSRINSQVKKHFMISIITTFWRSILLRFILEEKRVNFVTLLIRWPLLKTLNRQMHITSVQKGIAQQTWWKEYILERKFDFFPFLRCCFCLNHIVTSWKKNLQVLWQATQRNKLLFTSFRVTRSKILVALIFTNPWEIVSNWFGVGAKCFLFSLRRYGLVKQRGVCVL